MQKDDLNKYQTSSLDNLSKHTEGEFSRSAGATAKTIGGMVWKTIKTILMVTMLTGLIVFISVAAVILSYRDTLPPDIGTMSLNYSSFIKVEDPSTGEFEDYLTLASTENRVWVDLKDIPEDMKNAIIAIEDKRFYEHNGVDWYSTLGATMQLLSGGDGRGGSTLTQQLIKNITEEDDVSILRKVKEIFMALNLEALYTKDDIIEAYLNVVNFGSNVNGVQAAANLYFGKDINECDVAECASIAGITQYPYLYTPLSFPENNKVRQQTVIEEMHDQGLITTTEYNQAMEKSENMVFVGYRSNNDEESTSTQDVWNWYIETMITDLTEDLMEEMGYSREITRSMLYTAGLEIYCAMDEDLQNGVEALYSNPDSAYVPYDLEVQYGVYAMDYTGKTLAIVGSRQPKTSNLILNYATDAQFQTGSSIKALSVYAAAMEEGYITYGSVLKDQKIENYFGNGKDGPENFSRTNEEYMNVDCAVEISQNMPAAQLVQEMGVETSYSFLEDKLHFEGLDRDHDMELASLALGGFYKGATVREMTAGFQIFGNGGVYNEPYTYYYVKDHEGNVILDNRDNVGEYVISEENAAVMNKLLHRPIYGTNGTGLMVQIDGVDIFGKTGTSDDNYNLTFFGGTPYAVAGIWNGYADRSVSLSDTNTAKVMWRALMDYLNEYYTFTDTGYYVSDNIVEKTFCRNSGLIAGTNCYNTAQGWYANTSDGIPDTCNGGSDHLYGERVSSSLDDDASGSESSATPGPSESSKGDESSDTTSSTPNPDDSQSTTETTPAPSTPEPATPEPPVVTPTPTPVIPDPIPTPDFFVPDVPEE